MQKLYDLVTEQGEYTDFSVNSDNMSGGNEIDDNATGIPDSSGDEVKSTLKTISDSIDKLQQINPDFLQSDRVKQIMTDMMSICQMQMSDNGGQELSPEEQDDLHIDQNDGVEDDENNSVKMFESKQHLMKQFKRFL